MAKILNFPPPKPPKRDPDEVVLVAVDKRATGAIEEVYWEDDRPAVDIPEEYWQMGARFVLEARDSSLADMHIVEGDTLFMVPSKVPHAELPTVCAVNRKPFVRFFEAVAPGRYRLTAAGEGWEPIDVDSSDQLFVYGYIVGRAGSPRRRR